MAFNQANSRQIRSLSLTNQHIAPGAAIDETKINIDWVARTAEIFERKLLVDYVQIDAKAISNGSSSIVVSEISAPVADADTKKGAIVQTGKNKVILRTTGSGDPIASPDGTEVYAKLTHDGTNYVLNFFYKDASGTEQTYTFADATTVDFQFPERFDFNTIAENFAANEKFVDGASDVSARLDLEQIVKDTFGSGYSLNQDGDAVRPLTIVEEIAKETSGTVNTTTKATDVIDEVVTARAGFDSIHLRFESIKTAGEDNKTALEDYKTANDTRVEEVENNVADHELRIEELEKKDHTPFAEDKAINAGDALISTARYDLTTGTFVAGNKSLQVFYNGFLQMEGLHYTEITNASGEGIAVSFSPELIQEGDVIQLRWHK